MGVGVSVGVGVGVEGPQSLTVVSIIIVPFVDITVPSAHGYTPPSNGTVPPGGIPAILTVAIVQSV